MAKKLTNSKRQQLAENDQKKKLPVIKIIAAIVLAALVFIVFYNLFQKEEEVSVAEYRFTKEGNLQFTTPEGSLITAIDIEVADTPYETMLGLMYRKEMLPTQGMLFVFPDVDFRSFWMKNTILSLDMIFVDEQKKIVTIHKNTTPYAEISYPSTAPAKYVIEVIAGFTDQHKIKVGDKVVF